MIRSFTKLLFLLFAICLISCQDQSNSIRLLSEAQSLMEIEPAHALTLLDSISKPQSMDKDLYMQYLVAHVMAKHKTKQDIKNDTTIIEAVNYFENKSDEPQATYANFYVGAVYYEKGDINKAMKCFLRAASYVDVLKDNHVLATRIYTSIGNLYFDQYLFESAIDYYKKTLEGYQDNSDSIFVLIVNNTIGRAYEDIGQLDSAQLYFDKTLSLALEIGDKEHEQYAYQNLALVHVGKKEYKQAQINYHKLLNDSLAEPHRTQIEIDLLNICTETKDRLGAKKYVDILTPKMQTVEGDVLYELQKSFINYYKLVDNYKEVTKYTESTLKHEAEVERRKHNEALLSAHQKSKAYEMQIVQQANKEEARYYIALMLLCVVVVVGFAIVAFRHSYKENRRYALEIRKCNNLSKKLIAMRKAEQNKIH